jgi:rRNA maturation endonuclease Nob1
MFKFLLFLFQFKNRKKTTDNSVEKEPVEKRKCKGCLRRYDADKPRCPYCGCYEFYEY